MKVKIKQLWWVLMAGGLAALAGIGAVVLDAIRMHKWRAAHEPGPIA